MDNVKKRINPVILLIMIGLGVAILFFLLQLIKNCSKYGLADWIIVLCVIAIPCVLEVVLLKKHLFIEKKNTIHKGTVQEVSPDGGSQPISDTIKVSLQQSPVPKDILDDMSVEYKNEQALNDLRIIQESIEVMNQTANIETFLSRYETAMRSALTLQQAQSAGISVNVPANLSELVIKAKEEGLSGVLMKSFSNEVKEINKLKTPKGKLNRIDNYVNKLEEYYEDEFELSVPDTYNEIMSKLKLMKKEL